MIRLHRVLHRAVDLAELRKDNDSAVKWRAVADDIHDAAHKQLFNKERKAFYKGISVAEDGTVIPNDVIDMSSIFGAFMYGLFPIHSDETQAAIQTAIETFAFDADSRPGLPRYEGDTYLRPEGAEEPNWWFNTSLWLAQYYLEREESEKADAILRWVRDSAWSTGMLTEQVNPKTREEASLSPLCWSQAEYLSTLLDTITEKP